VREFDERMNKMSGLRGGVKVMAISFKTRPCAHQPVPWKRNGANAELSEELRIETLYTRHGYMTFREVCILKKIGVGR
jgi:hypothetical protein